MTAPSYEERVSQEQSNYSNVVNVHDLPAIFHYWANKHLLPTCKKLGFSHPDEFFANHLQTCLRSKGVSHFLSIGAGNCDTEVRVAELLRTRGHSNFVIVCQDINAEMLARGAALAAECNLAQNVIAAQGDFNTWKPDRAYDAVMASQSLHHVVELEHLFEGIGEAIGSSGKFITSDVIGRNGHMRWPEAFDIVQELWEQMPPRYRYNHQLSRHEERFLDWDCSTSGFEGVRAQDILPLASKMFHFEVFLPFGNVIDPFIDRGFGHNFDASGEWDCFFIDRVHAEDEAGFASGTLKPTHMFAVMSNNSSVPTRCIGLLTPDFCVRDPSRVSLNAPA